MTCTNNVQVNLVSQFDRLGWHIFMPFFCRFLWKSNQFKSSLTCTNNVQLILVLQIDWLGWHISMTFSQLNSFGNQANSISLQVDLDSYEAGGYCGLYQFMAIKG